MRKTGAEVLGGGFFCMNGRKGGRMVGWRKVAKALMVVGLMLCH